MAEHAHDHEHANDDETHDHSSATFAESHVDEGMLRALDGLFPALAEHLSLTARYGDLTDSERDDAANLHETVETEGPFSIGLHAEGDTCAVCAEPTLPVFEDEFAGGVHIPWASFIADLPVHVACVTGFTAKFPKPAPALLDQARRRLVTDTSRPPAHIAALWRHDVVTHGSAALGAWADNVIKTNEDTIDKKTVKGIQKLVDHVHKRLYH